MIFCGRNGTALSVVIEEFAADLQKKRAFIGVPPESLGRIPHSLRVLFSCDFVSYERNMSKFEGVIVVKAANVYFEGKVSSRTVEFPDGSSKTLGLMLPGEYSFNTQKPELMEITSGQVSFRIAGEDSWQNAGGGESFNVPGDSSFEIRAEQITDYICSFLDS